MRPEPPVGTPALLLAEGRILEAVASEPVLLGTLPELARQLDLRTADLAMALRELQWVSWVVAHVQADGRLAVRLERRSAERRQSVSIERRGAQPPAWTM